MPFQSKTALQQIMKYKYKRHRDLKLVGPLGDKVGLGGHASTDKLTLNKRKDLMRVAMDQVEFETANLKNTRFSGKKE